MSVPEKCSKCGAGFRKTETDDWGDRVLNYARFTCDTTVYEDSQLRHQGHFCIIAQRDQLAERVRELEVWKDSAMAVEHEWDPNQLATMLGGQLGESQRAVIQREVPRLVERVKRFEKAGRELARRHLLVVVTYPQAQVDVAEYEKAIQ